jgi:lipopolysaccharide transport system ATP-binding protein
MSRPIIEVRNISKVYRLGSIGMTSLKDEVSRIWDRVRGREEARKRGEFWALRDVSFDVQPGEVLGIIGRNGAGKSTLLKILSRITQQTCGEILLRGRVASLLEVGTGFHPDLTGRENIFLNGAILGMTKAEIRGKLDEIIAFAEVDQFIDTPVKRYSSGMYVRLAFAVAAHLEPEILIVDEVLAVGDASFQRKCIAKMHDASTREGRAVLFVSHNLTVISSLCAKALLLVEGRKQEEGPTEKVVSSYIHSDGRGAGEVRWNAADPAVNSAGRLRLLRAQISCEEKVSADVEIEKPTVVQYDFEVLRDGLNVSTSIHLTDKHGTCVLASGSREAVLARGCYRHSCVFPAHFLNDGIYSISIFLITESTNFEVHVRDAISFTAHERARREGYMGQIIGCIRPKLHWNEEIITPHSQEAMATPYSPVGD